MKPLQPLLLALVQTILVRLLGWPGASMPPTPALAARADRAATVVVAEVEAEPRIPAARREAWARAVYVTAAAESGWTVDALGDGGRACGVMQVWDPAHYLPGATCAKVRKDLALGVRAGIAVMLTMDAACSCAGDLGCIMTAFGTGKCGPPGWVLPTMSRRCKVAGLGSTCSWVP